MTSRAAESSHARDYSELGVGFVNFVDQHGLWDDARRAAAERIEQSLPELDLVRVVYGDPHGLVRSKTFTAETFRTVLRNGMDASPGPFVFDTGHAVAIDFFADGAGIGIPELTGAGDFIVVPDPLTFQVLPHEEARVGWIVGDEHLRDGRPHPLSSRAVLRRLVDGLAARSLDLVVGLEVEWSLTRYVDGGRPGGVGGFGVQGAPPAVAPVNAGYQFNLDLYGDQLMHVIVPLARALRSVGLPLRTIEHESGPGQLECTFNPMSALAAADAMLLFRSLTKQVCHRLGHHASFMALPALSGFDPSGWHLHQSLYDLEGGRNAFATEDGPELLSGIGRSYVGGLLEHAAEGSLLCIPTVNGYRRLSEEFSLSPDRVVWSVENRGSFVRVLGMPGAPTTHVENRLGEPCANPYLYIAAQLAAGLDGVDRGLDPGSASADPHSATARPLPRTLEQALTAFETSTLYRAVLGEPLFQTLCRLKHSELGRYQKWAAENGAEAEGGHVTQWEHREYFEIF
jgi:glutamine synthetase